MTRAVFVDKDGTLVHDMPYNVDPERIALAPYAREAVERMARGGYRVFVVSNQPGAAMGLFSESELVALEKHLRTVVPDLEGFYFCTHARGAGCACRKPRPGLLERAAREHGLELAASWMVGDILDDIEAGRRAGCRTILLDVGNETEWRLSDARWPDHIVPGLGEAAQIIAAAP